MPSGLLFDVDGTLVSFTFDANGTRKAMIEELGRWGLDTTGLSPNTSTQVIIDSARRQTEKNGSQGFSQLRANLYSILDRFEEESSAMAEVFPGTRDTLLRLRSGSIKLAVLTNSGRKAAYKVLRKADVLDCFEFVFTREDVDMMKPSPEGILKAVQRLSLSKDDVYYVGDGLLDIQAAKRAGLKVVSVATGNYTEERLKQEGADFVLSSLEELPALLGVL
jgi:HAD superfamily hydrolase (TIGR01662 family)